MDEGHYDCRHELDLTPLSKPLSEPNSNLSKLTNGEIVNLTSHQTIHGNILKPTCDDEISAVVGKQVINAGTFGSIEKMIASIVDNSLETSSFFVTNLSPIIAQFQQWKQELPMVQPFYAVKCNPDPAILRLLASLGCNFDCATMGEIDLILNGLGDDLNFGTRGLAPSSIVYANPAKMKHMLQFAKDNSVKMTVFDDEDELYKIAAIEGSSKCFDLLLRLTTDDKSSICRFSKKFGCPVADAAHLLEVAKSLDLNVVGVSFHVGSGCGDAQAYVTALDHAQQVFLSAQALGMPPMKVIDLGGGFPGDTGGYGGEGMPTFTDLAAAIRTGIKALEQQLQLHHALPEDGAESSDSLSSCMSPIDLTTPRLGRSIESIRFLAEPGRYFVSASTTIATKVYSRKGGRTNHQALYVDDGVYGSFNNVVYDHATPLPQKLALASVASDVKLVKNTDDAETVSASLTACKLYENDERIPTAVFGPTCDGLDQMCSLENTLLPRCNVDDWLFWDNMGAYTHTASYVFNGYTHVPNKWHCVL